MKKNTIILPSLTMRGLVIFPGMILHFDVGREKSIAALKAAAENDRHIFLVAQKDANTAEPDASDVYKIGVVAEIRQILKTPDNTTRVLVEGLYKAKISDLVSSDPYFEFEITSESHRSSAKLEESEQAALVRSLISVFKEYSNLAPKMPSDLYDNIIAETNLDRLFDLIVFNVFLKVEDKQLLLELSSTQKRIEKLIAVLANEISIMELEVDIHEQVRDSLDKNQREYYLREQMRMISRQLGTNDDPQEEAYEYADKISAIGFPPDIEEKLLKEVDKLTKNSYSSQESGVIRTYLDTVLDLPWNIYTRDRTNVEKARKQLDKDHYGLQKVKERILELIAVRQIATEVKGQIICLVGPPGVGKTSVGKSIATALGRRYARVSLGGVRDEAEIRGHRKTYVGAMPGRIANAISLAKSMNPVILLDEIDKMSNDYKGDPSSAMLEVLDVEQNIAFRDHYLEIPLDLSDVLFITTANTLDTIPAPLLDRMEIIELGSYTTEEKFNIAKKHLIPKQLKNNGESQQTVKITDRAIYGIIDGYTKEAGVRQLERRITSVCRKSAMKLVSGSEKVTVSPSDLKEFLGIRKYNDDEVSKKDEVGIVNGLAWTSVGGVIMPLEVLVLEGTGKIETTGSLGDVMKESAKIAVSLARSLAGKYGIDREFYKNKDLHIHAPEGAVPKDGPSAGVTMTTALISALSGIPIKRDVAMTGEITLHGKVLPIGGLKEKTMAAYRAGMKTVIIPKENEPDLEECDDTVKANIRFITAEKINTVLDNALLVPSNAPMKRSTADSSAGKKIIPGVKKLGKKTSVTVD